MSVDQAGHDVLAGGVDFNVARRPPPCTARECDRIECNDTRDPAVLQHDILRTRGRRTVSFNDGGIADHNPRIAMAADDPVVWNLSRQI